MADCESLNRRIFGKRLKATPWAGENRCIADFVDDDVLSEVQGAVECEERCDAKYGWLHGEEEGGQGQATVSECIAECEREIEIRTTGSVVYHPETLSLEDATLPLGCSRFVDEQAFYGQSVDVEGKEAKKLLRKLEKLGCRGMSTDWMHPHEFVGGEEWEEDPGVCYVHIKSAGRHGGAGAGLHELGRCRVTDVMREVYR